MADTAPWGALEGDKTDPNYGRVCGRCGGAVRQGMRSAHVCMTPHPEAVSMRLTKAAAQGPWELWRDECDAQHGDHDCDCEDPKVDVVRTPSGDIVCETEGGYANAAFIAHAHPGRVAAWLGCVARLRERVAEGHTGECLADRIDVGASTHGQSRFPGGTLCPCICGHEDDLAALGAVNEEKAP